MNDYDERTKEILAKFLTAYRNRSVPPPHFLLVGPDERSNTSVAETFSGDIGSDFKAQDCGTIDIIGDLSALMFRKGVAYLGNVQKLKKQFLERVEYTLQHGFYEIVIGEGERRRAHHFDLGDTTVVASCPSRFECPPSLLKVFDAVLTVEPPTDADLISLLQQEAWKDKIEIHPDAADLFVQACRGRTDILLTQLRRVCTVVPQIKRTNRPMLTSHEVLGAFERLRIELPASLSVQSKFNIQNLGGQDFERLG